MWVVLIRKNSVIFCKSFAHVFKVPRKQVIEKPSRAVEREAIEMERKNRLYTLLESDSDEDAVRDKMKGRKRDKDREKKRKHIRQKKESESSSDDEAHKR